MTTEPSSASRPTPATRAAFALASAALVASCFPPIDLGFVVGWFALVPLLFAVRGLRGRHAAALGLLAGFASAQLVFGWMYRFAAFNVAHGALLAGYVAIYTAVLAVVLAQEAGEPRGLMRVPLAAALIEWARAHAGFLALPWATFGQTQHRNLAVLQLAAYGGELLVGMLVVAVNVALFQIADAARARRRPGRLPFAVLALAAVAHGIGAARLATPEAGRELVVAAVQPAIEVGARDRGEGEAILERLSTLTHRATEGGAALVVWPESSVGALEVDLETKLAVRDIVEEVGVPVVLGSSHVEKLGRGRGKPGAIPEKPRNAAFVMVPRTKVAPPYEKVRLLPFAEYRPVDLPEWLAPKMFDTQRGARHATLAAGDVTVEPVICWENLFAEDVHATGSDEPTVIAHLVNDGWFGPTAQPALHALVSAVRAVEANRPVVVASNMGRSEILDARGHVRARASRFFAPDVVTATVRMPSGTTPYRRYGDWTWAAPALLLSVVLEALARRTRPFSARR